MEQGHGGRDTIITMEGGGRVRVRIMGRGEPPVVVVPDPPNVVEHYDILLGQLARDRRAICLELPGFGFFQPPRDYNFDIGDTAALLADVLDRLGVRGATVTCACIGAHAVLCMTQRRPELVERVLLVQFQAFEAAQAWVDTVSLHGVITTPVIGQIVTKLAAGAVVRGWYERALPPEGRGACYAATALEALRAGARFPLATAFQSFRRSRGCELTRGRGVDATVVWGSADPSHVKSEPRSALDAIPHARFIELRGVGHFPDLERPELLAELVRGAAQPKRAADPTAIAPMGRRRGGF